MSTRVCTELEHYFLRLRRVILRTSYHKRIAKLETSTRRRFKETFGMRNRWLMHGNTYPFILEKKNFMDVAMTELLCVCKQDSSKRGELEREARMDTTVRDYCDPQCGVQSLDISRRFNSLRPWGMQLYLNTLRPIKMAYLQATFSNTFS